MGEGCHEGCCEGGGAAPVAPCVLTGDAMLEDKDGNVVKASDVLSNKIVALYFSALWCDDCEVATPKVAICHEMANEEDLDFEVVFVSSDVSSEACAEYMSKEHGDWFRIPFDNVALRNGLKVKYGCFAGKEQSLWPEVKRRGGIPSMVVVDPSGEELVFGALAAVEKDGPVAVNSWAAHKWA